MKIIVNAKKDVLLGQLKARLRELKESPPPTYGFSVNILEDYIELVESQDYDEVRVEIED